MNPNFDLQREALQRAISIVGSATALAALLGITKGAISQWKDEGRSIPFEYGADIEAATGSVVTRRDLFPDDWQRIWPELTAFNSQSNESTHESSIAAE